jgi:uncharacterized membrane protein (DUF485 family)
MGQPKAAPFLYDSTMLDFKIYMTIIILAAFSLFGWLILPGLIPIGQMIVGRILIVGAVVTLAYNWWDEIRLIFKRKKNKQ